MGRARLGTRMIARGRLRSARPCFSQGPPPRSRPDLSPFRTRYLRPCLLFTSARLAHHAWRTTPVTPRAQSALIGGGREP